ncbi:alpha-1,6-mannosyltransferase subunit [Coccidioides immitis RS]|uniref:Mannosyltransferase n=2 Tax=Coccidioides immitis TaxID=5501 RepID=A0A0E1RZY6_COCIM|nr:alpha-1,6-mannosyltransferase subunit [Coccidioides immitis RS]EAS35263.2 alpha-1,6-mannosyltransferase subunit [Coccidioides immitis RS]KMU89506.1 membrane protein SB87 [Coccidioides immitis H538.4]
MVRLIELLLLVSIPFLIYLHLVLSPYTKVEESFNIQAAHDILRYGIPSKNIANEFRENYDHFTFPGAVPRTFVGALLLAGVARPLIWLRAGLQIQILVRAILGTFNALSLVSYARAVKKAFGKETGMWYIFFQASQFHVIYYASRTLPNMFAFGITTLALRFLLPDTDATPGSSSRRYRLCLYLLTVAGIVFRSEIALLLSTITIYHWLQGNISIRYEIIPAGLSGALIALLVSIPIDSFFWQKFPLWPELSAFLYNVVSGKASDWGVHPWHFYFTSAIPRLLLNPLTYLISIPLSCIVPARQRAALSLLTPSLAYIALYSLQPHKEWRFIIYTIPPLTTAAALGASYIWTHRTKSLLYRFGSISLILSTLAAFSISTFILLPVSMANYPGALALNKLHDQAHGSKPVIAVHLDTLACQTGVTHFLEKPPPKSPLLVLPGSPDGNAPTLRSGATRWKYDKTEDESVKGSAIFWDRLDYALVEDPGQIKGRGKWVVLEEVKGFGGIRLLKPGQGERLGRVEMVILKKVFGDAGVSVWEWIQRNARGHLTRGWWAEIKMVPKIKIMKQVRYSSM